MDYVFPSLHVDEIDGPNAKWHRVTLDRIMDRHLSDLGSAERFYVSSSFWSDEPGNYIRRAGQGR